MFDREEKEAFVSGLTGTSIWEIYGVVCTSSLGLIVRHIGILGSKKIANLHIQSFIFAVFWEFLTVLLPSLLCFTILADYVYIVTCTLLTIILLTLISVVMKTKPTVSYSFLTTLPYPKRSPALSTSRTWVNIFTAIAILAVDFNIFPRRFAKAETYGAGLMDVGVGCYIMCHGLVAQEARYSTKFNGRRYLLSVFYSLKKVIPYVVLGLVRMASVQATDYQQHVSEYGVHWNFFFTIVAVKIISTLISPLPLLLPDFLRYGVFATLLLILYQTFLSHFDLMDYIIYGPNGDFSRDNLISANREGIVSCLGFLAIYYLGVQCGKIVHNVKRKTVGEVGKAFLAILCIMILCVAVTMTTENMVARISRRAANISYCYWITSVLLATLLIMFVSDCIVIYLMELLKPAISPSLYFFNDHHKDSYHLGIMSAIDYNQFLFFLLANICTGLVNFTVDTIHASTVVSFIILILYLLFLTMISITLKYFKIKIF